MDSRMKQMEQELREVRKRAEDAERRADEERRQKEEAERRAEEERRQKEEERRQKEEEQRLNRSTTLPEYLELCHTNLFLSITIQSDKSLSTQGGIMDPTEKVHPDQIRPWTDFMDTQADIWERLRSGYVGYDTERCFDNQISLETYGKRLASRRMASEEDLVSVQRQTVEDPVTSIGAQLLSSDAIQRHFTIGKGIYFDNHTNTLSDASEEVILRHERSHPSTPARARSSRTKMFADQLCVYTEADGSLRKLAFVVEYKAAHKLTLAVLRYGLRAMDIKSVINRLTVPASEDPDNLNYHADRLVAAVITQTFSYMIHGRTQYGYITTGEAFVFLHIKPDDPRTVYYHLAEPGPDVLAQKSLNQGLADRTAVGQVLAFTLRAMDSAALDHRWGHDVIEKLDKWKVDYEAVLHSTPSVVRTRRPGLYTPASEYEPETNTPVGELNMSLRSRRAGAGTTCRESSTQGPGDDNDPPESDYKSPPDTPSRPAKILKRSSSRRSRRTGGSTSQHERQKRPFCTQACLLGLVTEGFLDRLCPNISDHCSVGLGSNRHRINRKAFINLLYKQLELNRDYDCFPLGKQGARGVLFKVTLTLYGYTVVAKGTVSAFVPDLQHEHAIYKHLSDIQGTWIPVCIGNFDLARPYYYHIGVVIIHMMILSWAGDSLDDEKVLSCIDQTLIKSMMTESLRSIHHRGVLHTDVRPANLLWNHEKNRIMVIDFERSLILEARRALQGTSPNRKRKRSPGDKETHDGSHSFQYTDLDVRGKSRFMEELSFAWEAISKKEAYEFYKKTTATKYTVRN